MGTYRQAQEIANTVFDPGPEHDSLVARIDAALREREAATWEAAAETIDADFTGSITHAAATVETDLPIEYVRLAQGIAAAAAKAGRSLADSLRARATEARRG